MESLQAKKSRLSNEEALQIIEKKQGLSKYELAKKLSWSMGKTDGAITRLLKSNRIFIKEIERDGRKVSLIYPINMMPDNTIIIPKSEIEVGNPDWGDYAFFYGLDSDTIGVTGKEHEAWNGARYRDTMQINENNDELVFPFPEEFVNFYNLEDKHYSLALNSNRVIITIQGKIIK